MNGTNNISIPPVRGLKNIGNTCYCNAVLQALFSSQKFIKILSVADSETGLICCAMQDIAQKMNEKGPPLQLDYFKSVFDRLNPIFTGYNQHDAEEFLSSLLHCLHEELKYFACFSPTVDVDNEEWEFLKLTDFSTVRENFGFMLECETTCSACNQTTVRTDPPQHILQIGVPESGALDLRECLRTEVILDHNCEYCKSKGVTCTRRVLLIHSPAVLIIQLKRYAWDPRRKASIKIESPVDIQKVMSVKLSSGGLQDIKYNLLAVVRHTGEDLSKGHYTCLCHRAKTLYEISDDVIKRLCSWDDYVAVRCDTEAYLVFYEKAGLDEFTQVLCEPAPQPVSSPDQVAGGQSAVNIGKQPASLLIATNKKTAKPKKSYQQERVATKRSVKPPPPSKRQAVVHVPSPPVVHVPSGTTPKQGGRSALQPSEEPAFAWFPDKFTPVYLTQEEVPGAKFLYSEIQNHSIDQLKRWLATRGMIQSGTKEVLVNRCKAAIENNRLELIDSAIDGGKWYNIKRDAVYQDVPESCRPPILPVGGWHSFPAVAVPGGFSLFQVQSYLIERHPTLSMDDVDSDGELVARDSMSVGTRKPLKRGQQYVKSGHVTEVGDRVTVSHYFLRAIVLSSMQKDRKYKVFVTCSKSTGYIVEGFCECRQRALGRCSHVAALLIFVVDHVKEHGYAAKTCTSRPQAWGQGTTRRKPGMVRQTDYPSRKSVIMKSHRDPRATRFADRMTPEERRNFLIVRLQAILGSDTCWETIITPVYHQFDVTDDYCEYIGNRCCAFIESIRERARGTFPCMPITSGQSEDEEWNDYRCWMVTASRAKRVSALTSPNAKSTYLLEQLWRTEPRVVTAAMEYGIDTEPVAKVMYLLVVRRDHPNTTLRDTGLWAYQPYPGLGCSPDGIVEDGDRETRLLEVKCPFTLKDHDPNHFETALTKEQLSRFYLTKDESGELILKKNHEYYYQVQMCLGIHRLEVVDLFVYSAFGHILIPVRFDPTFWDKLENKLIEVHSTLILPEYFAMRTVRGMTPMELPKRYLPVLYGSSPQRHT